MKIRVKLLNEYCKIKPIKKGEWIDLKCSGTVRLSAPHNAYKTRITTFDSTKIPLGIAMELPKYFEANILPRSGTFDNYGVVQTNGMGVIDSTFKGNNDQWRIQVYATRDTLITEGARIAQFKILPGQFAPWWVKLKWIFTSSINFEFVDDLDNEDRGGYGSTGII